MRRVGFFSDLPYGDATAPSLAMSRHPSALADEESIVRYLATAMAFAVAPEVSHDHLDPNHAIGTLALHTDGTWVWPSDLAYYVGRHHCALPAEFITHMQGLDWRPPFVDAARLDPGDLGLESVEDPE